MNRLPPSLPNAPTSPDAALQGMRFLEIGIAPLFKLAYPAQTDFYYSGTKHHNCYGNFCDTLSPQHFASSLRKLRGGHYDLVIAQPPMYAPWHPRSFLSMLKYRQLSYATGVFSHYAFQMLTRLNGQTPIVAVDHIDSFGIGTHNYYLFDRCQAYYKRELPCDNWLVFYGTGHRNLPGKSFRKQKRFNRYVEKLRPISIGAHAETVQLTSQLNVSKSVDIFFAGTTTNISTARTRGIKQILALRDHGISVDIPDRPLPLQEFLERCAAAHLVWSPAGFGWDCFRHYEAALAGSVTLSNLPHIERYAPLEDGVHAWYYPIEGDGLTRAVVAALRDKPRLQAMGQAAREHVLRYHTHPALCQQIAADAGLIPATKDTAQTQMRRAG